jgi:hypothetical protein
MSIERTDQEIDEQRNAASEALDEGGSKWPGMSYEQGVQNALAWVVGDSEDLPMED